MQVLALFVVLLCYHSVAASLVAVPEAEPQSTAVVEDTTDAVEKVKQLHE